jgi:cell division transport system permease protein
MTTERPRRMAVGESEMKRRLAEAESVREAAPIIPADTVAGRSLIAVVAIMTFLAALTAGTILLVQDAATHWRSDLAREITIQIRARDGKSIEAEAAKAAGIAKNIPGLNDVRILSPLETGEMLEPWLGRGLELGTLPVPKLIVARRAESGADLAALREILRKEVPDASIDDHSGWAVRLSAISGSVLLAGFAILALVMAATALSVVFATRSAVTGNRAIVEVLHFIGARDSYIASVFQRHFLGAGLKGALAGGLAAAGLFGLLALAPEIIARVAGAAGVPILFGEPVLRPAGYFGIAAVVLLVVALATLTTRYTVFRTLRSID